MDDDQMYANNGGVVPVFSGQMEDYSAWREDAMDWEFSTKFPDKIKATKLVLAQNDMVKKVMRQIGSDQVRSGPFRGRIGHRIELVVEKEQLLPEHATSILFRVLILCFRLRVRR